MQAAQDHELLRRYASEKAEDAFNALVSRYGRLVYSAALRQVGEPNAAQDVAQSVFVLLARKATSLPQNIVLSGWLYRATGLVAADARRAEIRRRKREEIAMEMFTDSKERAPWNEIQEVLDQAMHDLGKQERDFVLLRYFENRSLREIGEIMGVSDDAAQKRVSRALERLRGSLAKRGSKISATALGAALVSYSCSATPISAISAASLINTTVTLSVFSKLSIDFMAMTKLKVAAVVVAIAAAVSAPTVTQQRVIHELRSENQKLTSTIDQLKAEPAVNARPQITDEELRRLREDAAEVHRLRAQLAALAKTQPAQNTPAPAQRSSAPLTPGLDEESAKDPMKRQSFADKLVEQGKFAEALENYLWCFDEGGKVIGYYGVRSSFLLGKIKDLAKRYPPARDALATRRDALETTITSSQTSDMMKVLDYVRLSENLGESNKAVTLFDQLPENHPARATLVNIANDQFVKAGRYQDIVTVGNPEAVFDQFLFTANAAKAIGVNNPDLEARTRRNIIENGGRSLEALAGAGQNDRAFALADKILQYDSSPETKGQLLTIAQRLNNQPLIAHLNSK